jgi:hypothetical protein
VIATPISVVGLCCESFREASNPPPGTSLARVAVTARPSGASWHARWTSTSSSTTSPWTDDEHKLLRNKTGATRLGFALLLKYLAWKGRFPRGRSELPDNAIDYVARQIDVPPEELDFYDWAGRTIKGHRAEARRHLGFRECTVANADKLTAWLAEHVAQHERRPDRVRGELLTRCKAERLEPPSAGRADRIVASALHQAEQALCARISARIPAVTATAIGDLADVDADDDAGADNTAAAVDGHGEGLAGPALLAWVKADPGSVSLPDPVPFHPAARAGSPR